MVVDHRELGAVVRPDVATLGLGQRSGRDATHRIRRPHEPIAEPPGVVVHRRPRLGGVERFVRVELVDEQEPRLVLLRGLIDPVRGRPHGARAGEVVFLAEPGASVVVMAATEPIVLDAEPVPEEPPTVGGRRDDAQPGLGCPDRRVVGPRAPRVALVATHEVPGAEVGVEVLAARLEQVGMIGGEHGVHTRAAQRRGDRLLPQFDRPPRLPEEVERTTQDVVAGGHAGQRTGDVTLEPGRPRRESVEVRRRELVAAVRAEHVSVQRVEQDHRDVLRTRPIGGGVHPTSLSPGGCLGVTRLESDGRRRAIHALRRHGNDLRARSLRVTRLRLHSTPSQ